MTLRRRHVETFITDYLSVHAQYPPNQSERTWKIDYGYADEYAIDRCDMGIVRR
jgi:hypothetical protein